MKAAKGNLVVQHSRVNSQVNFDALLEPRGVGAA